MKAVVRQVVQIWVSESSMEIPQKDRHLFVWELVGKLWDTTKPSSPQVAILVFVIGCRPGPFEVVASRGWLKHGVPPQTPIYYDICIYIYIPDIEYTIRIYSIYLVHVCIYHVSLYM